MHQLRVFVHLQTKRSGRASNPLCRRGFNLEARSFAMLKEAHHFKQVLGTRVPAWPEHPHPLFEILDA
jgi:hypothetical protein